MKIAIAGGHSKKAPGASGYFDEYTEDRNIKNALMTHLKAKGYDVIDCSNEKATQGAELAEEVRLCNASGADYFIAIHFNAFKKVAKAMGTEVYYYGSSSKGHSLAKRISAGIADLLGLPNRGAKSTTSLYVVKNTKPTAILIEVCFCDSKADYLAYSRIGYTQIAKTITDELHAEITGTALPNPSAPEFKNYMVRVTASALNVRAGAGTMFKVVTVVKKGEAFTIVAKSGDWGKLKSGLGWIHLSYTEKV